jgi:Domain of unknown function (DUF4258)
MAQPHYVTETQTVRKVANDPRCRWKYTPHALQAMIDDGWTALDVEFALMTNGQVVLQEQKRDILWRIEGRDIDGRRIRVVVAVYEQAILIKVITTF